MMDSMLKGLWCIIGLFQMWKLSDVRESFTAKEKEDELTSFLIFNVLEVKIFQYDFLEKHVWEYNQLFY